MSNLLGPTGMQALKALWTAGLQLGEAWPMLDPAGRARVLTDLKDYLEQLHSLRSPVAGWIGYCTGGHADDHLTDNRTDCVSFDTVAEFTECSLAPI